jgi:hypothetical protein
LRQDRIAMDDRSRRSGDRSHSPIRRLGTCPVLGADGLSRACEAPSAASGSRRSANASTPDYRDTRYQRSRFGPRTGRGPTCRQPRLSWARRGTSLRPLRAATAGDAR